MAELWPFIQSLVKKWRLDGSLDAFLWDWQWMDDFDNDIIRMGI